MSTQTTPENGTKPYTNGHLDDDARMALGLNAVRHSGSMDIGELMNFIRFSRLRIPGLRFFWTLIQYTIVILGGVTLWAIVTVRGIVVCSWYFFAVAVSHIGWAFYLTQETHHTIGFNLTTAGAVVTGAGTLLAPLMMENASATLKTQTRQEWDITTLIEGLSGVAMVGIIMYVDIKMLTSGLLASSLSNPDLATAAQSKFARVLAIGIAGGSYFIAKQVAMHSLFKLVAQLSRYQQLSNGTGRDVTVDTNQDAEIAMDIAHLKTSWFTGVGVVFAIGFVVWLYNGLPSLF